MEVIRKLLVASMISIFSMISEAYSAWEGPREILAGAWGQGNLDFGIDRDDTSDRAPILAGILADGRIVISDQVNEREVFYDSNGVLLKAVPWYLNMGSQKTQGGSHRGRVSTIDNICWTFMSLGCSQRSQFPTFYKR